MLRWSCTLQGRFQIGEIPAPVSVPSHLRWSAVWQRGWGCPIPDRAFPAKSQLWNHAHLCNMQLTAQHSACPAEQPALQHWALMQAWHPCQLKRKFHYVPRAEEVLFCSDGPQAASAQTQPFPQAASVTSLHTLSVPSRHNMPYKPPANGKKHLAKSGKDAPAAAQEQPVLPAVSSTRQRVAGAL